MNKKRERCPHAVPPVLICDRCIQLQVDPPVQRSAVKQPQGEPKRRHVKAWVATMPDGKQHVFENMSNWEARQALRFLLGKKTKRGPTKAKWEARV